MDRIKIGILLALNVPDNCKEESLTYTAPEPEEAAPPTQKFPEDFVFSTCI